MKKGVPKKYLQKAVQADWNETLFHPIPESRSSWTATPKSKISRTRNNYLSKKQEQLLISESISEPLSWNGLFSSSRYSISDSKWQFIFDLLHLWKHMAGDLTRPGQRPGELVFTEYIYTYCLSPVAAAPWQLISTAVISTAISTAPSQPPHEEPASHCGE